MGISPLMQMLEAVSQVDGSVAVAGCADLRDAAVGGEDADVVDVLRVWDRDADGDGGAGGIERGRDAGEGCEGGEVHLG